MDVHLNLNEYLAFLDDIIVFSTSIQEHNARLDHVFERLRSAQHKFETFEILFQI